MIRLHMELQTCLVNECLVTLLTAVPGSMEGLFMPIQRIFFCKGGQQSLVLYVNLPVTQPPVDEMSRDFAWWEEM